MTTENSRRERQKQSRRKRILETAIALFSERGFDATTVVAIAEAAGVSRGTVFNYYPYKEAILLDYFGEALAGVRERLGTNPADNAIDALYRLFGELARFVESNRKLVLPLSYELLNPDPERSRRAFMALPLADLLGDYLAHAQAAGRARNDFSRERLARTLANTFFLTALQWAAYRPDRPIAEELRTSLRLTLEGIGLPTGRAEPVG